MITTLVVFCILFSLSVDYGALLLSRNWEEYGLHRGQRLSGRARLGEDRKAGHGRRDDRALSWFPRRCVFWAAGTGRLPSRLPGSTTGSASPRTMLGKEGETLSQRGSQVLYWAYVRQGLQGLERGPSTIKPCIAPHTSNHLQSHLRRSLS